MEKTVLKKAIFYADLIEELLKEQLEELPESQTSKVDYDIKVKEDAFTFVINGEGIGVFPRTILGEFYKELLSELEKRGIHKKTEPFQQFLLNP